MKILWIVGEPGSGKTTLVRGILRAPLTLIEKPKWTIADNLVAAGHYNGGKFDGADTVPYNGVQDALWYWAKNLSSMDTLFDGDRFSHGGCVDFFSGRSAELFCALLNTPAAECERRRLARGGGQNATWVKGRATKSRKFFDSFHGNKFEGSSSELSLKLMEWGIHGNEQDQNRNGC